MSACRIRSPVQAFLAAASRAWYTDSGSYLAVSDLLDAQQIRVARAVPVTSQYLFLAQPHKKKPFRFAKQELSCQFIMRGEGTVEPFILASFEELFGLRALKSSEPCFILTGPGRGVASAFGVLLHPIVPGDAPHKRPHATQAPS